MNARFFARRLLLVVVVVCGVAHVFAAAPPPGIDGDGVPAGLSVEEEVAWVNAHTPPLVVTPVGL